VEEALQQRLDCLKGGKNMTSGVNSLPQDLRTPDLLNRDLDPREGKVLLLHGLVYTAEAIGTGSHYSTRLETGDLIDLNSIPERQRAELREGQDYITKWTKEDVIRVQA
jgi:hypothetical protein